MDKPFFSIIVPVYNVEQYIVQCIKSVLAQSFINYELILVDDGSPDDCGLICDEYAESEPRIRVIHKNNGGLSSSRNAGLHVASGKYVVFLDSDDFWDSTKALEEIYIQLRESKADVLIFPLKRYYEQTGEVTLTISENFQRCSIITEKKEAIRYMIEHNVFRACACNKVASLDLINKHQMRFREGMLSEDMDWCADLLLYSNSFDYYNNPFYCYRQQREGAITKGVNLKLINDKIIMCRKGVRLSKKIEDKEMRRLLLSYYAYEYSVLLGVSYGVNDKKTVEQMKKLSGLLNYSLCKKVKMVRILNCFVGFGLTRYILTKYTMIKNGKMR